MRFLVMVLLTLCTSTLFAQDPPTPLHPDFCWDCGVHHTGNNTASAIQSDADDYLNDGRAEYDTINGEVLVLPQYLNGVENAFNDCIANCEEDMEVNYLCCARIHTSSPEQLSCNYYYWVIVVSCMDFFGAHMMMQCFA